MNINFTQNQGKVFFAKIPIAHFWKAAACIAITVAVAEGYWLYRVHSHSATSVSSPRVIHKNENMQFVGTFSQKMSDNYQGNDTLKSVVNPLITTENDSTLQENSEAKMVENTAKADSPYQLQHKQAEQTKEQLIAWLKQNMALVNDIRKVMYRIDFAKQKNRQLQDSIQVIHQNLTIIEDSIVLWKVRAVNFEWEVADNEAKRAMNALQKQESEWQKELEAAKERSIRWQSILHQYNEKLNFYKGK